MKVSVPSVYLPAMQQTRQVQVLQDPYAAWLLSHGAVSRFLDQSSQRFDECVDVEQEVLQAILPTETVNILHLTIINNNN